MDELNKVHHLNFLDNNLPDKCAKLLIADPPYYKVKGEFDFIWKTFDDYLKDVEKWAIECKRVLADNGTLFWYGDRKKIAYSQVILDKYFNLENSIYLQSATNSMTEQWDTLRSFYEVGFERLLMYSNQDDYNLTRCVYHIRDYIRNEIQRSKGKIVLKHVNEALGTATNGGGVASACLSLDKTEPTMITKEMYLKLQVWCYPELRKEYEELRKEYEELRRPFDNYLKLQDNWYFTKGNARDFDHETVKSENQTRAIILTCSRPGDLVVIPFAGSGTECAMSAKEGRPFIGFDIEKKHVNTSNKRCEIHLQTKTLF